MGKVVFIKRLKYKNEILFWENSYNYSLNQEKIFFKVLSSIKRLWRDRWNLIFKWNSYYFEVQDIKFKKLNKIILPKRIKIFKRYLLIKYSNED